MKAILIISAIAILVLSLGCRDYERRAAKGDAQMLVLADICSALKSLEEGKTNHAALILRTRVDRELLRISSNLAPQKLPDVYSMSSDFAQVKAYRAKKQAPGYDDEVLQAIGVTKE